MNLTDSICNSRTLLPFPASPGGDDVASELEKQRKAMEDDFGKRRAKFKEMFLQKEGEFCPYMY